jgi:hypothetical protein
MPKMKVAAAPDYYPADEAEAGDKWPAPVDAGVEDPVG